MNEARTGCNQFELRFSPSVHLGESTAVSIPHEKGLSTTLVPSVEPYSRECGGLDDTPAGVTDRDALLAHLGRETLHVSRDRDFSKAYRRIKDPSEPSGYRTKPLYWRTTSDTLGKFQYAMLTSDQYAAVLVVDIDQPGEQGGTPTCLAREVKEKLWQLVSRNLGPAWVGINYQSGKTQCLWLIDPVYANNGGISPNMKLLEATTRALGGYLDHDPHFAHRFSRSPFYTGDSPDRYVWYRQHHRIDRLGDFIVELRTITGDPQRESPKHQEFTSGRELIETVKARREEAQAFKALTEGVEVELAAETDALDPELIEGVRVRWINKGRAARDETAFRHALKVAHRLRQAGERMTVSAIIDAYEHAYKVAQRVGADGREDEMPPMRDRQTMARRVRGYVLNGKTTAPDSPTAKRVTTSQRKALATMGRRGGQKAAQRWKTDPDGDYAQGRREALATENKKRSAGGRSKAYQIAAFFDDHFAQTGTYPTVASAAEEFGVTARTIQRALAKTGIELGPGGRPKKGDKP